MNTIGTSDKQPTWPLSNKCADLSKDEEFLQKERAAHASVAAVVDRSDRKTVWVEIPKQHGYCEPFSLPLGYTPVVLKTKVQIAFRIPRQIQCMKFNEVELDDYRTLAEQDVTHNSKVSLTINKSGSV